MNTGQHTSPRAPRTGAARLRARLAEVGTLGPVLAPGAYDALSARLIEQAGFEAVYLTGFGASASLLGMPDVGLLGSGEMADQARRLRSAVEVPVIADADDGYGNPINVGHTVSRYEQAGVAAIQLEDQSSPKKCGHMDGKQVISRDAMVQKLRAATDARRDPDLLIVARTDAIATDGVAEALLRARAYRDAGADVIFVEAPTSDAELVTVADELASEIPMVLNWVEGGKTPQIPYQRIVSLGFALVLFPVGPLLSATRAVSDYLADVRSVGTPTKERHSLPSFTEFTDVVGMPRIRSLEQRYRGDPGIQ